MRRIKERLVSFAGERPWLVRTAIVALGASAGFAYYQFVGCASGTCPITSNPWISTGYGGLIGWLASPSLPSKQSPRDSLANGEADKKGD